MSRRYSRNEKEKWVPSSNKEAKRSPVRIPPNNNDNLIAAHRLTVIGRVTNPLLQRPRAVIDFLPQVWNLEGRVTGRDLGPEKFQMRFLSEEDIEAVLNKGPYHYKKWMILLQRWEPVISESFPSNISFWLRVHDLPLHYWDDITLNAIGGELGLVSDRVATDARVRVNMNGLLPLIMKLEIRLPSDEITTVEFEYLKIEKHCFTCFSLFHEEIDCPVRPRNPLPPKERKIGITQRVALQRIEADKKRHDDRRGYSRYQNNPRSSHTWQEEYRDHRSYSSREEYRRAPPHGRDSREPHWNPISERSRSNKESSLNKLSSGKIVSSREKPSSRCLVIGPSGDNTSRLIGSQSSHTPPPRPLRERLEYPTEPSSERTLSTSRERRSALARISEPDLRDKLQSSSPYNMEIDDSQGRVVPAPRASATLRIQEPEMDDNVNVNITIPASLQRSAGKRRVPSARKKVPRSPLQSLRLKKTIIAKSQVPARRRLCKDKDYTLPCNKAGPSVIPRSSVTRSQRQNRTEGQDFHPPPPPPLP